MTASKPCDFAHVLGYGRAASDSAPEPHAGEPEATPEQWAAIPFDPWPAGPSSLPNNREWAALANPHLVVLRLAEALMRQDKPRLVQSCEGMGPEAAIELLENCRHTVEVFEGFAKLASAAEARLLVALTMLELRGGFDRPCA